MDEEIRYLDLTDVETRSEDGGMFIKGYAAVFNKKSKLIEGSFVESIEKRAFDNVDLSDVFLLYNHNLNSVLGNTKSGTLELRVDDHGLQFEANLPDTQLGRDTYELIKRADVRGVSFGFKVKKDSWNTRVSPEHRSIQEFGVIREISITPFPAYDGATVSKRAMDFIEECRECRSDMTRNKFAKKAKEILKKVSKYEK